MVSNWEPYTERLLKLKEGESITGNGNYYERYTYTKVSKEVIDQKKSQFGIQDRFKCGACKNNAIVEFTDLSDPEFDIVNCYCEICCVYQEQKLIY